MVPLRHRRQHRDGTARFGGARPWMGTKAHAPAGCTDPSARSPAVASEFADPALERRGVSVTASLHQPAPHPLRHSVKCWLGLPRTSLPRFRLACDLAAPSETAHHRTATQRSSQQAEPPLPLCLPCHHPTTKRAQSATISHAGDEHRRVSPLALPATSHRLGEPHRSGGVAAQPFVIGGIDYRFLRQLPSPAWIPCQTTDKSNKKAGPS